MLELNIDIACAAPDSRLRKPGTTWRHAACVWEKFEMQEHDSSVVQTVGNWAQLGLETQLPWLQLNSCVDETPPFEERELILACRWSFQIEVCPQWGLGKYRHGYEASRFRRVLREELACEGSGGEPVVGSQRSKLLEDDAIHICVIKPMSLTSKRCEKIRFLDCRV